MIKICVFTCYRFSRLDLAIPVVSLGIVATITQTKEALSHQLPPGECYINIKI